MTLEVHRTDNVDEDESFLRHGILFKVTLDDLDSKCLFAAKNQMAGNPLTALFFFLKKTKHPVELQCTPSAIGLFYSSGNYTFSFTRAQQEPK